MNECQQFDTVNLFKLHFSSAVAHFVIQRDVFGTCTIGSVEKIAFASFWLVFFFNTFLCRNRKIYRQNTIGKTLKVGRMSVLHANSFKNQCCSISCVINILDLSTLNLATKKNCCYQNKSAFFIETHYNLNGHWTYTACTEWIIQLNRFTIDLYICVLSILIFFFQLAFVQSKTHSHTNSNFSTDSNHYRA